MIINTWGGSTSTAYNSWDEVNSYLVVSKVFYDSWLAANTVQGGAAILQATREIDGRLWRGGKFFALQALEFPRVEPGTYSYGGSREPGPEFYQNIELDDYLRMQQQRVRMAHAEQTLYVLDNAGRDAHREDQYRGIGSQSRGIKLAESYSYREPSRVLCPAAWDLLRHYKGMPRIVRGDAGFGLAGTWGRRDWGDD